MFKRLSYTNESLACGGHVIKVIWGQEHVISSIFDFEL